MLHASAVQDPAGLAAQQLGQPASSCGEPSRKRRKRQSGKQCLEQDGAPGARKAPSQACQPASKPRPKSRKLVLSSYSEEVSLALLAGSICSQV